MNEKNYWEVEYEKMLILEKAGICSNLGKRELIRNEDRRRERKIKRNGNYITKR